MHILRDLLVISLIFGFSVGLVGSCAGVAYLVFVADEDAASALVSTAGNGVSEPVAKPVATETTPAEEVGAEAPTAAEAQWEPSDDQELSAVLAGEGNAEHAFDVVLIAEGKKKSAVLREVRQASGLSADAAKTFVRMLPRRLSGGIGRAQAETLKRKLLLVGAQAAVQTSDFDPKGEYEVRLFDFGSSKIQAIKEVRAATGLGLKASKRMVDNLPATVGQGLKLPVAERLTLRFELLGASVVLSEGSGAEAAGGAAPAVAKVADTPEALSVAQVNAVIAKSGAQLAACMRRKSGRLKKGKHVVRVDLSIGKNGKIDRIDVVDPVVLGDTRAGLCMAGRLKRLLFPKNEVVTVLRAHSIGTFRK